MPVTLQFKKSAKKTNIAQNLGAKSRANIILDEFLGLLGSIDTNTGCLISFFI